MTSGLNGDQEGRQTREKNIMNHMMMRKCKEYTLNNDHKKFVSIEGTLVLQHLQFDTLTTQSNGNK
jgi:DeoR/GlpR family transcriptional regulator of sugar metabolism